MSDFIEYHYTGRLWVLPFSREYEFSPDHDPKAVISGSIDEECFTTDNLERLISGERYMVEFEDEPSWVAGDNGPSLICIRSKNGEPITEAQLDLPFYLAKLEARIAALEKRENQTDEASRKLLAKMRRYRAEGQS